MMKKILLFSLAATLVLSVLTGCSRNVRRDQTLQESTQPAGQTTLAVTETSVPTEAATVTQARPSETPTVQPTDTSAPSLAISQSTTIESQLDSMLNQIDTQLQGVDTIPETP
jgi:outer membrane lipopolysaccharide assembly protein LptE/RlpB